MTARNGGIVARGVFASGSESAKRHHPGEFTASANIVFTPVSGDGTISGTVTLNGAYSGSMWVLLLQESRALPLALKQVVAGGVYSFTGLPTGNYAVVVVDTTGAYRSKVIHTVVP